MIIRPLKSGSQLKAKTYENIVDEYDHDVWRRGDYFSLNGIRSGVQIQKQEVLKNPLKIFTSSIFVKEIADIGEAVAITPRSHKYSALLNGGFFGVSTVVAFSVAATPVVLGIAGYFGLKAVSHSCAGAVMRREVDYKGYKRVSPPAKKDQSLTHP